MGGDDLQIPQYVKKVLDCLADSGFEAYMAGGCVRDSIMGRTPNDYDITTNATPEQMLECFADFRVIPTGLQHGTVTVVSSGNNIEVTTYRIDGEYADNRHPMQVTFTSRLEDDLARRDFTVNAMAMDADGNVCDPFGGMEDVKNGIIRCVGDGAVRFAEDGLRILRCIRFASVLDFEVEADTSAKVHQCRALLDNISRERIMSELQKLLCGKAASAVCAAYGDVTEQIIPAVAGVHNPQQFAGRLERSCNNIYLRLALLLYDLGADEAGVALRRLKCDNVTHSTVKLLISNSDIPRDSDRIAVKKYLAHMGKENFELLTFFVEALKGEDMSHLRKLADELVAEGCCLGLGDLAINGTDVCAIGAKGTQTGVILKKLLDSVICETLPNSRDVLINKAKELLGELSHI